MNKISETPSEMIKYNLIGIIVHTGQVNSGHYVSYSKRGDDWYLFDDENTRKVSAKDVSLKEAYILLYQKDN